MEEVLLRFEHLGEDIFDSLDNKSLTTCKKVSKMWNNFINDQKYFWIRFIMNNDEKINPALKNTCMYNKLTMYIVNICRQQSFRIFQKFLESCGTPVNPWESLGILGNP